MNKILLITVRADFGGGPKHVDQVLYGLKNKFSLYIASPNEVPFGRKWSSDKGFGGYIAMPHRQFSIRAYIRLLRYIKQHKIKTIHSHGKGAGIYSRLLKILLPQIQVIHTFHGLNSNYGRILNRCYLLLEKVLNLFTDKFVFVSQGEQNKAKAYGIFCPKKSSVIHNGIKDPDLKKYRRNSPFNIASISRFDYAKNMDFAFDIANSLKNDLSIKFTWVGDGEDKQRLQTKAISDNVNIDFIGFVNDPMPYLQESDLLLSTSRFEGLPYALIESCSIGVPIVATNVVGNNEVVEHGLNGFLFDSSNEAIEYIKLIKQDPNLLQSLSEGARLTYENKFSLDKMLDSLAILYNTPQ